MWSIESPQISRLICLLFTTYMSHFLQMYYLASDWSSTTWYCILVPSIGLFDSKCIAREWSCSYLVKRSLYRWILNIVSYIHNCRMLIMQTYFHSTTRSRRLRKRLKFQVLIRSSFNVVLARKYAFIRVKPNPKGLRTLCSIGRHVTLTLNNMTYWEASLCGIRAIE
jgi:hypothetical protein